MLKYFLVMCEIKGKDKLKFEGAIIIVLIIVQVANTRDNLDYWPTQINDIIYHPLTSLEEALETATV